MRLRYIYNNFVYALLMRWPDFFIVRWLEMLLRDDDGNRIIPRCQDCGRVYGDPNWIDVIVPDDQWIAIGMPEDGSGLLCGACIIERGAKLPWATVARLRFEK